MKSLYLYCILLVVFVATATSKSVGSYYDDDAVERGDAYVDKLIKDMMEDRGHEYDPYVMEDSVVGFSRKVAFVNISGEAKLHNGYIAGLKTLHRPDHCSLKEKNDRLYVKADLGAGILKFQYEGTVKFMNWGPTVTVHGELSYIEVHMEFSVDAKTGENGTLHRFAIDDIKGLKVWITGLGPLNWAVNPIIKGVNTVFKRFVKYLLENKVKHHIADRLPNFKFPVEGEDIETTTESIIVTAETEATEQTEEPITTEGPVETEEPITTEGPVETEEPITTEGPVETEEPITTEGPVETEEPITTEGPVETEEPITTEGPVETEEPITTEGPVETEEPPETEGPVETEEPLEMEGPVETEEPEEPEEADFEVVDII
ncbi:antigen AG231, partial [Stegodyphus mimosarum]